MRITWVYSDQAIKTISKLPKSNTEKEEELSKDVSRTETM